MNLLKSLVTVGAMTLFSRVLGFVRDVIVARYFGAGVSSDVFFVAFKLPNLLRRIFAEGAFSQAFVPVLAEYKNRQNEGETRVFISSIAGLLTLILAVVTAVGVVIAPVIILITAPGFASPIDKFDMSVVMLRITFPYIFFISLSSLVGAILNTWHHFFVPAFAPALLNISMIGFTLFVSPYFDPPILSLAVAVVVGGILQLLYQLPSLKKIGMLVLPRINLNNSGLYRVLRQMIPAMFGVSVSQVSLIINTIFASFLVSGSISWMYYADRLMEFPAGILGAGLGTILLPSLSRCFVSSDEKQYSQLLDWALRLCLMLALPASVAMGMLSAPLVSVLFEYGKFTHYDALMTQQALIAYAVGLLALILVKILASAFYACQNIRTPVRIAMICLLFTQLMNVAFIIPLKHAGLALSISLAACINASLLFWQLKKNNFYQHQPGWLPFIIKVVIAVCTMATTLFYSMNWFVDWSFGSMLIRIGRLGLVILAGMTVYFGSLFLLGFRLRHFLKRIE